MGKPRLKKGVDLGPLLPLRATSDPSSSLSSSTLAQPLPPELISFPKSHDPTLGQHMGTRNLGMGKRTRSQKHERPKSLTLRHRETQLLISIKHHAVKRQTEEKQIVIPITDKGHLSLDLLFPPPGVFSALSFQASCSPLCALGFLLPADLMTSEALGSVLGPCASLPSAG